MPASETLEIASPLGVALHTHLWTPPGDPKGLVSIVHGLGEHSARYDAYAQLLASDGWVVVAHDHRGHGLSGGLRGHVDGFVQYSRDLDAVLEAMGSRVPEGLPLYLMGHSMGGLIVLHHQLVDGGRPADGLILSNPLLKVAVEAPKVKVIAGRLMARLLPKLRLDNEIDATLVSRDASEVQTYVNDPLVHSKISTRWFTSMEAAKEAVKARPSAVSVPTYWVISGQDRIVHPDGARNFCSALSTPTEVLALPEAFHEPHNGPDRGQVHDGVRGWLTAR